MVGIGVEVVGGDGSVVRTCNYQLSIGVVISIIRSTTVMTAIRAIEVLIGIDVINVTQNG